VLHCDFGITALRLNTDTQHMGYVLGAGETDVPAGLKAALLASNRMQDFVSEELRPGRTGNEVLRAAQARMRAAGIDGTIYSHPIGLPRPRRGAADRAVGLPGRRAGARRRAGHPAMWYSIELQATSPVPEWGGSARAVGAGGGRDHRRRRAGAVGVPAADAFHLVR
jgi:hypothetical protein